jgi:hypothetical protein
MAVVDALDTPTAVAPLSGGAVGVRRTDLVAFIVLACPVFRIATADVHLAAGDRVAFVACGAQVVAAVRLDRAAAVFGRAALDVDALFARR